MRTTKDLKPGDEVIYLDVNSKGGQKRTVERAGRTNIYLVGFSTAFDRETGRGKDGWGGNHRIVVPEQHDNDVRVEKARAWLRQKGVEVKITFEPEQVLAIAEALVPILGEPS